MRCKKEVCVLGAQRDKYGNVRTGLKFYEFQTNFHLHRQPLHLCVCACDRMRVTLVQLAS